MSHSHEECVSLVDFILTSVNSEFMGVRVVLPWDLPRCNQILGSDRDTLDRDFLRQTETV